MESNNEKEAEKDRQQENKILSQVGEDPRAGVRSKLKDGNNDKQIAREGDPTRSDE